MIKSKACVSKGKAMQICGTGSGVGKSVITAGLCRIFAQDGYRVSPFKAQNMALNSFVTKEQGEIGRAQATQAQACGIEPSIDMNPILIKPTSDVGAQIIVLGKAVGNMDALQYINYKSSLIKIVKESFNKLINEYEIVVIEGAGSPAEINLKSHDIVNMKMAKYADAPVILVGDIDKGGVFAWIIGTLQLLTKQERKRIKGIIINKFRGDKTLLTPGIDFLEKRTGIKVLGIVPYFKDIKIPEEDSVSLEGAQSKESKTKKLDIAVIHLPHISNFTDFDALEREPDVILRYVRRREELDSPDIIIIPGTKNTIADLLYLRNSRLAQRIVSIITSNGSTLLIGICGGYQMLGKKIHDAHSLESNCKEIEGLGLLPIETRLEKNKVLTQVKAKDLYSGMEIKGYEIHHGHTKMIQNCESAFEVVECSGKRMKRFDGARSEGSRVFGTYVHGLFDTDSFRRDLLNKVRERKGWDPLLQQVAFSLDEEFNKLAKLLRENINIGLLYKILNHELWTINY